jgi:hypothetical protein
MQRVQGGETIILATRQIFSIQPRDDGTAEIVLLALPGKLVVAARRTRR